MGPTGRGAPEAELLFDVTVNIYCRKVIKQLQRDSY